MHRESAEEKLLRLIKSASNKEKEQGPAAKGEQEAQPPDRKQPYFKSRDLQRPELAKRRLKPSRVNLGLIYGILRLAVICISIFFIFDFFYSARSLDSLYRQEIKDQGDIEFTSFPKRLEGEFSDYSANLRDIFTASKLGIRGGNRVAHIFDPLDYIANLNLLGIISGMRPQAVIEDSNENKNYTVGVGDYIKDFFVEEIGSGRVSLDYQGEKFELFL